MKVRRSQRRVSKVRPRTDTKSKSMRAAFGVLEQWLWGETRYSGEYKDEEIRDVITSTAPTTA